MVSFNTVEKTSFKSLLKTLDRPYDAPGQKYFSQVPMPEMYNRLRHNKFWSWKATTLLWWRSSIDMTLYMLLTVLFINKEWKISKVSKCLQAIFFPEEQTAEKRGWRARETLIDRQLDQIKPSAITTDNAANIVAASRTLDWQQLNCFMHNLNLAKTNALWHKGQCTERVLESR